MFEIINDIKAYLALKIKYKKRYLHSKIGSLVPKTTIIEDNVEIKENVYITNALKKIGSYTYIGNGSSIFECESIGKFCSISHGVKIGLTNHPLDYVSTNAYFYSNQKEWLSETTFKEQETKRCIIENDVLISANAMIMNGVKLGNGCIIGAGAFVNKDVPPYAIVVGSPAKIIKYRFDNPIIDRLLLIKWWDMKIDELVSLKDFFPQVEKFLNKLEDKK